MENIGHYGLALDHYCHFTSPIRRYSDLVLHRLLFDETTSKPLDQVARHCSDQERVSAKAEMSVIGLKKLRWLQHYDQNHPSFSYNAAITKVKPFGIYFDVAPLSIEGFIHVSELSNDYYEYQPKTKCLIGQNTHLSFKVGNIIQVTLVNIDLIVVEATWAIATLPYIAQAAKTQKKKKLTASFYLHSDVVAIGKQLLGKFLFTLIDGQLTGGMITETESYGGADDKACHAYQGRRTKRTEVMFSAGGVAYVYLCYGIHHLFNIVTHEQGTPHAILIRSIYPTTGDRHHLKTPQKKDTDQDSYNRSWHGDPSAWNQDLPYRRIFDQQ